MTPSQQALILAAEQLFAQQGIDAVSDREIARAAGQKNNSAVAYHFGGREGLLNAILDLRMQPLNQQRNQCLDALEKCAKADDVSALLHCLVQPYVDQLHSPESCHYFGLLCQLFNRDLDYALFTQHPQRASSLLRVSALLLKALAHLPQAEVFVRLSFCGIQIINTVNRWQAELSLNPERLPPEEIQRRTHCLVGFLSAGLSAPHAPSQEVLP